MIASLRGRVVGRASERELIVEVGGVGYLVAVPAPTAASLLGLSQQPAQAGQASQQPAQAGQARQGPAGEVFLHIHTHLRQDAIVLYGFAEASQRAVFELLVSTHGIGPALALAILSAHTPASLQKAVAAEDLAALTSVPGVGKKTAQRLLVELGTALDGLVGAAPGGEAGRLQVPGGSAGGAAGGWGRGPLADTRHALAALGYEASEVRSATSDLPDDLPAEELLKMALKQLVAG
ncbi:MAG: Holliday junction branch migration protein RuvA [Acidimicrobiales bacterium]